MDPIGLFLLLLAISRKNGHAPAFSSVPATSASHPAYFPQVSTPQHAIPVSVPSGPTFSKKWVPYHPLNSAVIQRAEAILHDPNAPHEVIEPDPAGSGQVRYLKLNAPKGHWSVTAWKPSLAGPPAGVVTS